MAKMVFSLKVSEISSQKSRWIESGRSDSICYTYIEVATSMQPAAPGCVLDLELGSMPASLRSTTAGIKDNAGEVEVAVIRAVVASNAPMGARYCRQHYDLGEFRSIIRHRFD